MSYTGEFRAAIIEYVNAALNDSVMRTRESGNKPGNVDAPLVKSVFNLLEQIEKRDSKSMTPDQIATISRLVTKLQMSNEGLYVPIDSNGALCLRNEPELDCVGIISSYLELVNQHNTSQISSALLGAGTAQVACGRNSKAAARNFTISETLIQDVTEGEGDGILPECENVAKAIKKQFSQRVCDPGGRPLPGLDVPSALPLQGDQSIIRSRSEPLCVDTSSIMDACGDDSYPEMEECDEARSRLLDVTPVDIFCKGNNKALKSQVCLWIKLSLLPKVLESVTDPLELKFRLYSLASNKFTPYSASVVVDSDCVFYGLRSGRARNSAGSDDTAKILLRGLNTSNANDSVLVAYIYRLSTLIDMSDLSKETRAGKSVLHAPFSNYSYTRSLIASGHVFLNPIKIGAPKDSHRIRMNWVPSHISSDNIEVAITESFVETVRNSINANQHSAPIDSASIIPLIVKPPSVFNAAVITRPEQARSDSEVIAFDPRTARSSHAESNYLGVECALITLSSILGRRQDFFSSDTSLKWALDVFSGQRKKSGHINCGVGFIDNATIANMMNSTVAIPELSAYDDTELASMCKKVGVSLRIESFDLSTLDVDRASTDASDNKTTDHLLTVFVRKGSGEFISDCFRDSSELSLYYSGENNRRCSAAVSSSRSSFFKVESRFSPCMLSSTWSILLSKGKSRHPVNQNISILLDRDLINSVQIFMVLSRISNNIMHHPPSESDNPSHKPMASSDSASFIDITNQRSGSLPTFIRLKKKDVVCITAAKISTLINSKNNTRVYRFIRLADPDDIFPSPDTYISYENQFSFENTPITKNVSVSKTKRMMHTAQRSIVGMKLFSSKNRGSLGQKNSPICNYYSSLSRSQLLSDLKDLDFGGLDPNQDFLDIQVERLSASVVLGASLDLFYRKKDVLYGALDSLVFSTNMPDNSILKKAIGNDSIISNELNNIETTLTGFRRSLKDIIVVSIEAKLAHMYTTMSILLGTFERISLIEIFIESAFSRSDYVGDVPIHASISHDTKEHILMDICMSLKKHILSELIAIFLTMEKSSKAQYFNVFKHYLVANFSASTLWGCMLDLCTKILNGMVNTDKESGDSGLSLIKAAPYILSVVIMSIHNYLNICGKSSLEGAAAPKHSTGFTASSCSAKSPTCPLDLQATLPSQYEHQFKRYSLDLSKHSTLFGTNGDTFQVATYKIETFLDLVISLFFKDYKGTQVNIKESVVNLIDKITPLLCRILPFPKLLDFSVTCLESDVSDFCFHKRFFGSQIHILKGLISCARDSGDTNAYDWFIYGICNNIRRLVCKISHGLSIPGIRNSARLSSAHTSSARTSAASFVGDKYLLETKIPFIIDILNFIITGSHSPSARGPVRDFGPSYSPDSQTKPREGIHHIVSNFIMPIIPNLIYIHNNAPSMLTLFRYDTAPCDNNSTGCSDAPVSILSHSSLSSSPPSPPPTQQPPLVSNVRDTRLCSRKKQSVSQNFQDTDTGSTLSLVDVPSSHNTLSFFEALENFGLYILGTIINVIMFGNGQIFTKNLLLSCVRCPVYFVQPFGKTPYAILESHINLSYPSESDLELILSGSDTYKMYILGYLDFNPIVNLLGFINSSYEKTYDSREHTKGIPDAWILARIRLFRCIFVIINAITSVLSAVSSSETVHLATGSVDDTCDYIPTEPSRLKNVCRDPSECGPPRIMYSDESRTSFSPTSLENVIAYKTQKLTRIFSYTQRSNHGPRVLRRYSMHSDRNFEQDRGKLKHFYNIWLSAVKYLLDIMDTLVSLRERLSVAVIIIDASSNLLYEESKRPFALIENLVELALHYNFDDALCTVSDILQHCVKYSFTNTQFTYINGTKLLTRILYILHSRGQQLKQFEPFIFDALLDVFVDNEKNFILHSEAFYKYLHASLNESLSPRERVSVIFGCHDCKSHGNDEIFNFFQDLSHYITLVNKYILAGDKGRCPDAHIDAAKDVYLFTSSRINLFTGTCLRFLNIILDINIKRKNPTEAAETIRQLICILLSNRINYGRINILCDFLYSFFTRKKGKIHQINCLWDNNNSRWIQNSFNIRLPTEDPRLSQNIDLYISHSIEALLERAVKIFSNTGNYERALSLAYLWGRRITSTHTTSSIYLSIPLSFISSMTQKVAGEAHILPVYYLVSLYGKGWKSECGNGDYIYRCADGTDINTFSDAILDKYPGSSLKMPELYEFGTFRPTEPGKYIHIAVAKPVINPVVRGNIFSTIPTTINEMVAMHSCCDLCYSKFYPRQCTEKYFADAREIRVGLSYAREYGYKDPKYYIIELDKKLVLTRILISSATFGAIIVPVYSYGYSNDVDQQYSTISPDHIYKRSMASFTEFECKVRSYFNNNDTSYFLVSYVQAPSEDDEALSRSFSSRESKILKYRTVNHIIKTSLNLPSICTRSSVESICKFSLTPLENAIIATRNKTFQLLNFLYECLKCLEREEVLKKRMKGWEEKGATHYKRFSMFTMYLSGTVDAQVNGGTSIYKNAFLSDEYAQRVKGNQKELDDIKMLQLVIGEQIEVLRCCFKFHKKLIHDDMIPFHANMLEKFEELHGSINRPYKYTDNFNSIAFGICTRAMAYTSCAKCSPQTVLSRSRHKSTIATSPFYYKDHLLANYGSYTATDSFTSSIYDSLLFLPNFSKQFKSSRTGSSIEEKPSNSAATSSHGNMRRSHLITSPYALE